MSGVAQNDHFVNYIQDIQESLNFAQTYKLETRIRSGRHSMTDYSICDGIVIDISNLKSVYINTEIKRPMLKQEIDLRT
ncbi:MAG: FAD-binding protein [Saprospiraceae bacterium]|nr:FAD-binding protein [Saprospiraceae bacterium]